MILRERVYTADEKLLKKAKELPFMIHIKNFKLKE
jgi:predicted nucleic acid-binding protein